MGYERGEELMVVAPELLGVSAGLDLVSGVFGYLNSLNAASVANSRADMIRAEADANAQRYSERATAFKAQQKLMFLASGVKVSGSVIDVLDNSARLAAENIAAIRAGGAVEAFDQEQVGQNALTTGRNALLGGIDNAAGATIKAAFLTGFGSTKLPAPGGGTQAGDPGGATGLNYAGYA